MTRAPAVPTAPTDPRGVTEEVFARTEYRGPPWDLSVLDGVELVYRDGIPMDTWQHRLQMDLLIDACRQLMLARGRTDYFAAGDLFVYYTPEQARFVATHQPPEYQSFVGPDFLFVDRVPPRKRQVWKVWDEDGRYPDIIAELLSPSTAHIDKGPKKTRYAEVFGTSEYYLYRPGADAFTAHRLSGRAYREVAADARGRVHSPVLDAWLGLWHGTYRDITATWLRLSDERGAVIPTAEECACAERQRADSAEQRADSERQRADSERQRADGAEEQARAADAEVQRLRALLRGDPETAR